MRWIVFVTVITGIFLKINSNANDNSGSVIRGKVIDKQTQTPLPGATVLLQNSDPLFFTATNDNGEFRLEKVPLGRQTIIVSYIGYHTGQVSNLIINVARETVLIVELE